MTFYPGHVGLDRWAQGGTMSDEVSQAIWELGMAMVVPILSFQHQSAQGRGQVARSLSVHMPGSSQDVQGVIYLGVTHLQ